MSTMANLNRDGNNKNLVANINLIKAYYNIAPIGMS